MAGGEDAVPPASLGTSDRLFLIVHPVISQYVSASGIGGDNPAATVDDPLGLIEIDRFRDVIGNDGIVLAEFRDAIHLNGKKNGNLLPAKVAGEGEYRRCSPTLAEENNVGGDFFLS